MQAKPTLKVDLLLLEKISKKIICVSKDTVISGLLTHNPQMERHSTDSHCIDIEGPVKDILAADKIYRGGDIAISISSNTLRGCVIIGILFGVSIFGGFWGALGGAFLGAVVFSFSPQGKNMDELQIVSSKTLPGSVMLGTISTVVITKFVVNGISSIIFLNVDPNSINKHIYALLGALMGLLFYFAWRDKVRITRKDFIRFSHVLLNRSFEEKKC